MNCSKDSKLIRKEREKRFWFVIGKCSTNLLFQTIWIKKYVSLSYLISFLFFLNCNGVKTSCTEKKPELLLYGYFAECNDYYGMNAYGYCIYNKSDHLESLAEVEKICSLAQEWESYCRFNWVFKQIREHIRSKKNGRYDTLQNRKELASFDELIKVCGEHTECAYELIDTLPSKDIQIQLDRCKKYTKSNYQACSTYALQEWSNSNPTEEETNKVFSNISDLPQCTYQYISKITYCNDYKICEGDSPEQLECQSEIRKIKKIRRPCAGWRGCICTQQGELNCTSQGRQEKRRGSVHVPHEGILSREHSDCEHYCTHREVRLLVFEVALFVQGLDFYSDVHANNLDVDLDFISQ